jgi:mycoredoxin
MRDVTVYGANWCEDTQRTLALLSHLRVSHHYVNIERDEDAKQKVEAWYPGAVKTPVVVIEGDGTRLVEPHDVDLLSALISIGIVRNMAA